MGGWDWKEEVEWVLGVTKAWLIVVGIARWRRSTGAWLAPSSPIWNYSSRECDALVSIRTTRWHVCFYARCRSGRWRYWGIGIGDKSSLRCLKCRRTVSGRTARRWKGGERDVTIFINSSSPSDNKETEKRYYFSFRLLAQNFERTNVSVASSAVDFVFQIFENAERKKRLMLFME